MKRIISAILVLLLTHCISLALSAPTGNGTEENVESLPTAATDIIFDDSATEIALSDNLEATTPAANLEDGGDATQSDDDNIPQTTSSTPACGNDIDSPADCPSDDDFVSDDELPLSAKTDDNNGDEVEVFKDTVPAVPESANAAKDDDEKATTMQP